MKKLALALAATASLALGGGGSAAADPTCANGWRNHGDHVRSDYVSTGTVAGGAPSHRGTGLVKPGASFCLDQAQSRPVQSP